MVKLKTSILLISVVLFCSFIYGVVYTILAIPENQCRMTYMFELPQFTRIKFDVNREYPKYALYAYSEGSSLTENARNKRFTGAPVIFVPGNSGSYKQVRSLASVALRKGLDNYWKKHLDFFSIDYNEELSAFYGGYLIEQQEFLKLSIVEVLKLYEKLPDGPKQVILIGHSMGGKVAESVLFEDVNYYNSNNTSRTDDNKKVKNPKEQREFSTENINTIIAIASPVHEPVLKMDLFLDKFYREINEKHEENLRNNENGGDFIDKSRKLETTQNYCAYNNELMHSFKWEQVDGKRNFTTAYDKILFVTIGGGDSDLLVRSKLTETKYSDIHALTTSIPNVWLSTDHLCSVWCLQLMLTINRFLFSITVPSEGRNGFKDGQHFIHNKEERLQKALHYFVKPNAAFQLKEIDMKPALKGEWIEDSRQTFSKRYMKGLEKPTVHMVRLPEMDAEGMSNPKSQLYVEILNTQNEDWLLGCSALESTVDMRYCSRATSLNNYVRIVPSGQKYRRDYAYLNLRKIKEENTKWTHILIYLSQTRERVEMSINVHDFSETSLTVDLPEWYNFNKRKIIADTDYGKSFYQFTLNGLERTYQAVDFIVKENKCSEKNENLQAVGELCIPWARGCNKFQYVTKEKTVQFTVNTPKTKPLNFTDDAIVNIHLNPNCRYTISYRNSIGKKISLLIEHHIQWLPAHIVALLLICLREEILLRKDEQEGLGFTLCFSLYSSVLKFTSIMVLLTSHIFIQLLSVFTKWNIQEEESDYDFVSIFLISCFIHGIGIICVYILISLLWLGILSYNEVTNNVVLRFVRINVPSFPGIMDVVIDRLPIAAGALLISAAIGLCSGLALLCASCFYFLFITNDFEDHIKEFIQGYVKVVIRMIYEKIFRRRKNNQLTTVPAISGNKSNELRGQQKAIEDENVVTQENLQPTAPREKCINSIRCFQSRVRYFIDKLIKRVLNYLKREYLEDDIDTRQDSATEEYHWLNDVNFHMVMFLLLAVVTVINFPLTITWAKYYNMQMKIPHDPSAIAAVIISIDLAILWQFPNINREVKGRFVVGWILLFSAVISLVFCSNEIYHITTLLSSVLTLVTLYFAFGQTIARNS